MENLQITSLEQLKAVKQTEIVDLGKFEDGTKLIAEVRMPDMMELVRSNKIPNELLAEAVKLFNGKTFNTMKQIEEDNNVNAFKQLGDLLEVLTESCLVNPSYNDIKTIGLIMPMDIKMNILMYAQGGLQALKGFREEQECIENNQSVVEIQQTSVGDTTN